MKFPGISLMLRPYFTSCHNTDTECWTELPCEYTVCAGGTTHNTAVVPPIWTLSGGTLTFWSSQVAETIKISTLNESRELLKVTGFK